MAILLSAQGLKISFGGNPLFRQLHLTLEQGERVGMIGPNGAGKSTLLKILAGLVQPDAGTLSRSKGLVVGYLPQVSEFTLGSTVMDCVTEGIDASDIRQIAYAYEVISLVGLNDPALPHGTESDVNLLSGGWRKRVALARELAKRPNLLLLDEPTNHLDVESIFWLEDFLINSGLAVLTITHDRAFLQQTSQRIVEINSRYENGLLSIKGDYQHYLEASEQLLAAQEVQEKRLKNTLRREIEWLRRGAQARQTKQSARIRNAEVLAQNVQALEQRNQKRNLEIKFGDSERAPVQLIKAAGISKSYNGKTIVPPVDVLVTPKTRLGILGRNGCGKSTLIRMLTAQEAPDKGEVSHGERLRVAYFEQNREALDPNLSLLQSVCPEGDFVDFGQQRVHVRSYLSRFLFRPEQAELPVKHLSGGEQSRLMMAQLMLKPANILILDEPTNDLDIPTLDVLLQVLQDFDGAVVLVTHDRYFLDQVVDDLLAFGLDQQGEATIERFAGLEQWETWHAEQELRTNQAEVSHIDRQLIKKKPVSTKELQRLKTLCLKQEKAIETAEAELSQAEISLAQTDLSNYQRVLEQTQIVKLAKDKVDRSILDWEQTMFQIETLEKQH